MASFAELQDALVNADRAGDTAAARQLADAIHAMRRVDDAKPAAVQAGETLGGIPRQVGLTARYGLEGLAQAAEVGTEPLRRMVVNPLMRAAGLPEGRRLSEAVGAGLDAVGLPQPQGANERVIGDATRLVAGSAGLAGGARLASNALTGVASKAAASLGSNVGQQLLSAGGAGLAGGSVREAGGGPAEQFIASLAGGLAVPVTANALGRVGAWTGNKVGRAFTPQTTINERVDQQITLALERSGVDWSQVPERLRQSLRGEVEQAMNTGQPLNADAMRRLLVMKRAGVEPTVGQLTQDPGQITREANLAKTGANSTDAGLQRLPALQNRNTQALLTRIDEAGAARAPNATGAARSAIESLGGTASRAQGEINALYKAARDTSGRSLPLEGGTFTSRANQMLDEANVGSFLPPDIARKMNAIAGGEYPLTVDVAEQLKTSLGNLQRGSSDGNVRHALGIVRQALDEAPLQNATVRNPGNVPAAAGAVPPSVGAGEDSIQAFNAARSANRQWRQKIEANPALKAVVDGVEPDQFVQRYVVGKGASAADVGRLAEELTPPAREAMRQHLVRHLKDAATGSTDDITKFSGAGYRRALRDIGDEKLAAFFSKDEMQQLRDVGDAAKYMQAQPAGAAVNNSNSGALVLGRGLDTLDRIAGYVPLGGKDVLRGLIQGQQQRQVLAPANALRMLAPRQQRANPLLALPLVLAGQRTEDR